MAANNQKNRQRKHENVEEKLKANEK